MSSITITRVTPLNGPPITKIVPKAVYPQATRDDASWAFQHLADLTLNDTTSDEVLVRAETALEGALDALAAVRKAKAFRGMHTSLAWRTADSRSAGQPPQSPPPALMPRNSPPPPAAAPGAGR